MAACFGKKTTAFIHLNTAYIPKDGDWDVDRSDYIKILVHNCNQQMAGVTIYTEFGSIVITGHMAEVGFGQIHT